ncbi:MAG: hypothetical protein WB677_10240 [Xanthobacteraceae bacterium]
MREDRRELKAGIDAFIHAVETDDDASFDTAMEALRWHPDRRLGWRQIVRRISTVHPNFRIWFAHFWKKDGEALRDAVDDDLVLIDLLRCLLPPYTGPAVELFRGDYASNRRHRTYGVAWSSDRSIATDFATNRIRLMPGKKSVLLRTLAPPAAIICSPHELGVAAHSVEAEYIVDRRRLNGVTVLERFTTAD